MTEISFEILGEPQGRVHTTAIPIIRSKCPGCQRGLEHARPYRGRKNVLQCSVCRRVFRQVQAVNAGKATDAQKAWVATAKDAAAEAMAQAGLEKIEDGAVKLTIEFIMPRPKHYIWKTPHAEPRHWKLPDRDNLEKALKDSFKGILWRDDAQVSEGPVSKRYARPGEACRAIVTVRALGEWYGPVAPAAVENGQMELG